jgi:hypothetical protein
MTSILVIWAQNFKNLFIPWFFGTWWGGWRQQYWGLNLRALCLLYKCSTPWAIPPDLFPFWLIDFWWCCGLNSEPHTCLAGILPLEPLRQLALVIYALAGLWSSLFMLSV